MFCLSSGRPTGSTRTETSFPYTARFRSRKMILASDEKGRRAALAKLLPFQRQDFVELFRIMAGLPVTIRLLDPPLHEFLPHTDAEMNQVADAAEIGRASCRERVCQYV